jgi:aspartate racemase
MRGKQKKIGLIGGMSFESTAVYYRLLNQAINRKAGKLHSASLVLESLDFQDIVLLQQSGRWQEAGEMLAQSAKNLAVAGADCVMICAVTMHLVAEQVATATHLPLIHALDALAQRLAQQELRRPLLIATRYTMEHGFFQSHLHASGIDVMLPAASDRAEVHRIIFEELCAGQIKAESRDFLLACIDEAMRQGADSVILGCTELGLILSPTQLALPALDAAVVHVEAALDFALGV